MKDNRNRLILNVDDNEVGRYTITRILRRAGFMVAEATDGLEALRLARESPDLILLDVKLPDISGLEVCRRIKLDPRTAHIPVVHLSAAYVENDDLAAAIEQGADGYLTHPVDAKVLIATINAFLRLKEAEENLRESEERFRSLYENSAIGLYRTTPDGKILLTNPALVKMLGYESPGELIARNLEEQGYEPRYRRRDFIERLELEGEIRDFESIWILHDGREICVSENARAVRDAQGRTLFYDGSVSDITAYRKAEEKLRLSEQTYRGILNSITDAVYIKNESGTVLDLNYAAEKMFGYTKEELAGETEELIAARGASDLAVLQSYEDKALHGESQSFEFQARRKNGTDFPVDISYSPGVYFGQRVIIVIARDITERKAVDELLRDVQRREAIGVMSSGIAHDFNNLLAAMMGNVSLAQMHLAPEHPVQKNMSQALLAMETAAELVQQILAYSGKGTYQNSMIELGVEIARHVSLFRLSMPKNVKLVTDIPPEPVYVNADPAQVKQIIMNLIMNGGEAMGERNGVVSVALAAVELERDALRPYTKFTNTELKEGAYAMVEVRDNGVGMSDDMLSKIFDPFYSTKFIGRGLGLAAVLGIIRSHEGGIAVESVPGKGTAFRLVLPLAEAPEALKDPTAASTDEAQEAAPETGTILVIDDEENIAMMAREILESGGYTVLTELNPVAGIELFREHRGEIGAVLLDLSMPEMSGKDVMNELLAIDPGVRIILSSGYTEQDMKTKIDMTKIAGFIQKPYTLQSLLAMAHAVLR